MTSPEAPAKPVPEEKARATILVTGDVVREIYVYQGDRVLPNHPGEVPPHFRDEVGGAKGL